MYAKYLPYYVEMSGLICKEFSHRELRLFRPQRMKRQLSDKKK